MIRGGSEGQIILSLAFKGITLYQCILFVDVYAVCVTEFLDVSYNSGQLSEKYKFITVRVPIFLLI